MSSLKRTPLSPPERRHESDVPVVGGGRLIRDRTSSPRDGRRYGRGGGCDGRNVNTRRYTVPSVPLSVRSQALTGLQARGLTR